MLCWVSEGPAQLYKPREREEEGEEEEEGRQKEWRRGRMSASQVVWSVVS